MRARAQYGRMFMTWCIHKIISAKESQGRMEVHTIVEDPGMVGLEAELPQVKVAVVSHHRKEESVLKGHQDFPVFLLLSLHTAKSRGYWNTLTLVIL